EAAKNGQTDRVKALLDADADVNATDVDGMTPLMWAAFGGHTNTVRALLDAGADVSVKDKQGSTARIWATPKIVTLLRSYEVPLALYSEGGQQLGLNKVDFKEISFEIRGTGWQREETASGIILTRSEEQGRAQNLAIWPIGVPSSLRSLSQQEHISKYFDSERHLPRYEGRWEGFTEGEREIAGHGYPTLSFRIVFPAKGLIADGLFLLYFPQDFEERQRFYVLMWQDGHPIKQQGKGFDDLDAVVASFQVRPVGTSGQPSTPVQTRTKTAESLVASAPIHKQSVKLKASSSTKLILGVPFISWREAARLEYQDKEILNPSFAASLGMVLKYWGQDLKLLKKGDEALPRGPGGWGHVDSGEGKNLNDLKRFIDRGIPVIVSPAMTPYAHTLDPGLFAIAAMMRFQIKQEGICSGVLGRMVSLGMFRDLEARFNMSPWESLLQSSRVVIGYDDKQKIVILHDPSFGPAWQVSFDDFEKMWKPTKRWYLAAYPPSYAEVLAKQSPAPDYAPRTPDQQAAEQFVFSYALSCVGRMVEAQERLKNGLAIPGIAKGYQHLLLFELALQYGTLGNTEEAIAAAQKATELLPEHHRPWGFLAEVYRSSFIEGWQQKAAAAERRASDLCSDPAARKIVARVLARDVWIFVCESLFFG
ncbi:ankyrin repeat domain-containing protein, partial [Acidobacteria bacterium AH-259-O06]|nr:ankyrin repeat domain-containing protein [Acidobacteria bacterium AH-259-O06]